jgi:hypothetical protein
MTAGIVACFVLPVDIPAVGDRRILCQSGTHEIRKMIESRLSDHDRFCDVDSGRIGTSGSLFATGREKNPSARKKRKILSAALL